MFPANISRRAPRPTPAPSSPFPDRRRTASRRRSDGRRGSTDADHAPPRRRCPPRSPCPATTAAADPDSRERSSPRLCARRQPRAPEDHRAGRSRWSGSASDTSVTIAPTKGTSTSAPASDVTDNNSPAAVCSTSLTLPTTVPSVGHDRKPLELVVVELVGIVDRRQVCGVDEEDIAPQALPRRCGRRRLPIAPATDHCARGRIR